MYPWCVDLSPGNNYYSFAFSCRNTKNFYFTKIVLAEIDVNRMNESNRIIDWMNRSWRAKFTLMRYDMTLFQTKHIQGLQGYTYTYNSESPSQKGVDSIPYFQKVFLPNDNLSDALSCFDRFVRLFFTLRLHKITWSSPLFHRPPLTFYLWTNYPHYKLPDNSTFTSNLTVWLSCNGRVLQDGRFGCATCRCIFRSWIWPDKLSPIEKWTKLCWSLILSSTLHIFPSRSQLR